MILQAHSKGPFAFIFAISSFASYQPIVYFFPANFDDKDSYTYAPMSCGTICLFLISLSSLAARHNSWLSWNAQYGIASAMPTHFRGIAIARSSCF